MPVARAGDPSAPNGSVPAGSRAIDYTELDLPPADPRGLVAYVRGAFAHCVAARPTTINGVSAMRGTAASELESGTKAHYVLLMSDHRVNWAVLDGSGWTPAAITHALTSLAGHHPRR